MKTNMKLGTILILLLLLAIAVCWSQDLSLYGEVTKRLRGKDFPAAGFKSVLVKAGKESAPAYASRTGKYGIYSRIHSPVRLASSRYESMTGTTW